MLAVACVTTVVVAVAVAVLGARSARIGSDRAARAAAPKALAILSGRRPFTVFRSVDRSDPSTYGRILVAALHGTTPGRGVLAGPTCKRVAVAGGKGICLDELGTRMAVELLDDRLHVTRSFELPGIPSRARVSPDGRWGGVTAFIVGHAYAAPGQFSTATTLIDLRRGVAIGNLEKDFRVTRDGAPVDERDRNYWGLTFAPDGDTFYATLATGGQTYLVQGSIRGRSAHVIHENVECPSVSPDGGRIGYKQAVSHNPTRWRFHVLDLGTGQDTALAETRSVDDQLAWLDDEHLLYGDGTREWLVAADGSGRPQAWIAGGDSATVAGADSATVG